MTTKFKARVGNTIEITKVSAMGEDYFTLGDKGKVNCIDVDGDLWADFPQGQLCVQQGFEEYKIVKG